MGNPPAVSGASVPQLRGLHNAAIKRNLTIAIGLTAIVTVAYKILINDPRKEAYAKFYQNYDAKKSFERMKENGRFQSC